MGMIAVACFNVGHDAAQNEPRLSFLQIFLTTAEIHFADNKRAALAFEDRTPTHGYAASARPRWRRFAKSWRRE